MISWQGENHPIPEPIVWTKRGLRVRTAVRWTTAVIFFAAMVAAMVYKYGA